MEFKRKFMKQDPRGPEMPSGSSRREYEMLSALLFQWVFLLCPILSSTFIFAPEAEG